MAEEIRTYVALFLGQVLGAVIVVAGVFLQGGIETMAIIGGVLLLLCIAGLAYVGTRDEPSTASGTDTPDEASGPSDG
ncbi:hypothetical protein [Halopiger djelfimassiliensis]|uniref:hypothetical protein n=1 Tax=Halopiger djelfimassiliensis TaxID=1293047 RepID=UPI000677D8B4|nr:hypothetical protein [Halopiger djelfimassiliensis]